jgi:hypothetical protein
MTNADELQRYARIAGVAMLLTIVFGGLGEAYVPGQIIVSGDAATTAAHLAAKATLFRLGFASYLVEGICDVALCVFFYILLKPVNRNLALLSAFFGIASMVTYAVAESSYYAALAMSNSAGIEAFTVDQRNALGYLALRIFGTIATLFLTLYGIASIIRGYLIFKSGYLPKFLGILLMIGGVGFFLRTWSYLLAPSYSSGLLLVPMAVAGVPLMLWLLIRGIDRSRVASR